MNRISRNLLLLSIAFIFFYYGTANGQVFIEKQTRHRFAQMTLGVDYHVIQGGESAYLDQDGIEQKLSLRTLSRPRFIIGGTHFWGHADFFIAIPLLDRSYIDQNQEIAFTTGIETSFKYYPWKITNRKFRPYIGTSYQDFNYMQNNLNEEFGKGQELSKAALPVLAGFTYNYENHLLEIGMTYNFRNKHSYYLSEDYKTEIELPKTYFALSYRYMFETTLSAEKSWESGKTAEVTDKLAADGGLNNFFLGIGASSSIWMGTSSYNIEQRPFATKFSASLVLDYTLGYHWHKPDVNLAINYRGSKTSQRTYKLEQGLTRKSIGLEMTKVFADYHGFAPFIGPIVSYDQLTFIENYAGENIQDKAESKFVMGLTFGWDIRPNRLQSVVLRTNLRWFPSLDLEVAEGQSISFKNLEFNFIQAVVYPGRF